jgi:hypothetical protein
MHPGILRGLKLMRWRLDDVPFLEDRAATAQVKPITRKAKPLMRIYAVSGCLFLGACASDSARWATSNREEVLIEGSAYRVVWLQIPGGIDAHSNNTSFVPRTPDVLIEKRQATDAMRIVARRKCRGDAAVVTEATVGTSYAAEWHCATQPAASGKAG